MTKKKNEYKREKIEVKFEVDWNRLCGDIREAAAYLLEVAKQNEGKEISLDIGTSGYDHAEVEFCYMREETDAEFELRVAQAESSRRWREEDNRRRKQRDTDLAELNRLKLKLGL